MKYKKNDGFLFFPKIWEGFVHHTQYYEFELCDPLAAKRYSSASADDDDDDDEHYFPYVVCWLLRTSPPKLMANPFLLAGISSTTNVCGEDHHRSQHIYPNNYKAEAKINQFAIKMQSTTYQKTKQKND